MYGCKHYNILGLKVFYGWCSIFGGCSYRNVVDGRKAPDFLVKKIGFFKKPNGDYKYEFTIGYKINEQNPTNTK